ncbi:LINGO2 [Branchiostoma lanceolatum]|uniref:LINGO2 protein n=1 Tax=Branchiostoma lanceolatum TaxID=7740 RepID=A0A8J9ZPA5_BRALA|nr:LINGO2 [Branchiostoma lanceolatum]
MFVSLGNLQTLYLHNNDISSIETGTFSHTPRLQRLELYGNNLTSIPQGVFDGLNQLQYLSLYSNHMKTIPPNTFINLQQLLYLYLHDNEISSIPTAAFANLPRLQQLCLSSNQITHIQSGEFSNLPQLRELQLQSNQLTSIPTVQYQFPELIHLNLHNNNITDIPANAFSNQPKLSTLHLYSNRISTVSLTAFTGLANLNTLYLYNNQLTDLPDYLFFGLSSLSNLRLQDNDILQIFPNTFTGISSLTYLLLNGNSLKTFPSEELSKISSIAVLYLQNNQMATLSFTAYDMMLSDVSTVDISNNPWQCDCQMVSFRLKMTGSNSFENQITCTDPRHNRRLLKNINPEDLTCEEPMIVRFEKGDDNSVEEGETLHMVCEASGIPTPDITVILPSGLHETVESGGRVIVEVNGTVTITDVTAADAGLYICIAASPVGSAFKTLSVDVQSKEPATVTSAVINITGKPESTLGSAPIFSLPVLLGSVIGAVAGTVLIGCLILMIWCKRKAKNPPPVPDTSVVFNNTNTTATVTTSGHDQTGQGWSHNVTNPGYAQRPAAPQPTLDLYEDVEPPPNRPTSKGAGPKQPAKKKALKPPKRNKAPHDERPSPPPPRTGAAAGAAAVYANEPAAALDNLPYYQPLTKN